MLRRRGGKLAGWQCLGDVAHARVGHAVLTLDALHGGSGWREGRAVDVPQVRLPHVAAGARVQKAVALSEFVVIAPCDVFVNTA